MDEMQADKKRREVEFQVGDWVYWRIQPYRLLIAKCPLKFMLGKGRVGQIT